MTLEFFYINKFAKICESINKLKCRVFAKVVAMGTDLEKYYLIEVEQTLFSKNFHFKLAYYI